MTPLSPNPSFAYPVFGRRRAAAATVNANAPAVAEPDTVGGTVHRLPPRAETGSLPSVDALTDALRERIREAETA